MKTRSPATVARHRRILQAIVNWAAEEGLLSQFRLPRVHVPPPVPRAWTVEEIERLLWAASRLSGRVGRVPAGLWWPAFIITIYWSGARLGSILAATPHDWDGQSLTLRQTKNGRPQVIRLHPQANAAIRQIYDPDLPRLFWWDRSKSQLYYWFRIICSMAGLEVERRPMSLFHRLRRTCLSYCWATDPGVATRQAGHSDPRVTLVHYVDLRIASQGKQASDVLPVPKWDAEQIFAKWEASDRLQLRLPFPYG